MTRQGKVAALPFPQGSLNLGSQRPGMLEVQKMFGLQTYRIAAFPMQDTQTQCGAISYHGMLRSPSDRIFGCPCTRSSQPNRRPDAHR